MYLSLPLLCKRPSIFFVYLGYINIIIIIFIIIIIIIIIIISIFISCKADGDALLFDVLLILNFKENELHPKHVEGALIKIWAMLKILASLVKIKLSFTLSFTLIIPRLHLSVFVDVVNFRKKE